VTPLRLAVIGVGDVAQRDYLPEFGRIADRAVISVVCGRGEERAAEVAARFGVPRWSTDYREVVSAEDVDAVVNLTPIPAHREITLAALQAGRHVYSEKPLASTAAEAQELHDEAERQGVVLVAAPSLMLFPQLLRVREIVASGELGPILAARAHAIAGPPPWAGYDSDPTPFFSAEGGPLVDMAVYPLHALTGLLGHVTAVSALASRARDSFVVAEGPYAGERIPVASDDSWQLLLRIGSCLASVEANFSTVPSPAPECELRGELGGVAFSLLDVSAPISVLRSEEWVEEPVEHEREAGPDHILGVEHLLACVSSGERPVAGAEHAVHVIDVMEAARQSIAEERTVAVARRPAGAQVGS
jgi:predicted dehydrogenase